jgi:uncharacterized paraquat-inducible protein A
MIRCPACQTPRVVVVLEKASHGRCVRCGVKWVQDGSHQRHIRRPSSSRTGSPSLSADVIA